MNAVLKAMRTAVGSAALFASFTALAADYPAPKEGSWVARDFRFHTGEVMPELRLHYTTVGEPDRRAGADPARHDRLGRRAC